MSVKSFFNWDFISRVVAVLSLGWNLKVYFCSFISDATFENDATLQNMGMLNSCLAEHVGVSYLDRA